MTGVPKETDVVVIGSGVSGMAAALTAAEAGAGVLVLEKQRSIGGTSNFFHGIFAVESEMQRQRYITYSADEAFRGIMEYSHWRANARLVRAIVNESGPTISWLREKGVQFIEATTNMPDTPRCYHPVKGAGAAVMKTLVDVARNTGVGVFSGMPVTRILKRGDKVAGVAVEKDGEDIEVAAGAVVVASGGYANNKEWIKKYAGFDLDVNVIPVGNTDKMGDGIRMAWETGAAEEGMGVLELFRVGPLAPDLPMMGPIEFPSVQPDLWVDANGERFCDETVGFYDTSVGNAAARQKEGYTWSIFDDSIIERVLTRGIERGIGSDNPPGTKPADFWRELDAAFTRGSREVFAADSVEELAAKLGMAPAALKATVDEYNSFCAKGHDDLFAKEPKYLRPLKGPRFYASKMRTVFLGTLGGIKINERTEVLDKKGKVIPGLYAVGFDAGGMWGDSYSIKDSTGLSAGFAANSGRIAGRNAARYMGK